MNIRFSDFMATHVLVCLFFFIFVAPFILLAYMRVAGPQQFRGGAARWLPTVIAVAEDRAGRSGDTAPVPAEPEGTRIHKADGLSPLHLETVAKSAADLCGLDRDLAWSLALRESSGRHWAADGSVLRSSSNALGLFQIKVGTAQEVAGNLDIMTPWGNAVAGACHMRKLLDRYRGDVRTALHAYHAGSGAVRRKEIRQATHDYATDILEGSAN